MVILILEIVGQDVKLHELVTVYKLGDKLEYTVPCYLYSLGD